MKKRGKILRDTSAGNGLLMIEGQQYPFALEGMWQSEQAPRVGMTVEAAFDAAGAVAGVQPVADAQLAREQSEQVLLAARAKGGALASGVVARLGVPLLTAMALLALSWFALNTVVVNVGPQYSIGLSLWKLLGVLNAPGGMMAGLNGGGGSAGLYGLLAIVALLGPAAPRFWHDARAHLGSLLPLAFMLLVAALFYHTIGGAVDEARSSAAAAFGGPAAAEMISNMQQSMQREVLRAISIGVGLYLACAISLYFAVKGAIAYLAARAA